MKFKLFFICLALSTFVFGQRLKEKELVGTWKTEQVKVLPFKEDFADKIQALKAIFAQAKFTFQADHNFVLTTSMTEMNDMFSNKYWSINVSQNRIGVYENKDRTGALIEITVSKSANGVIFKLEDSPLELTMKKL